MRRMTRENLNEMYDVACIKRHTLPLSSLRHAVQRQRAAYPAHILRIDRRIRVVHVHAVIPRALGAPPAHPVLQAAEPAGRISTRPRVRAREEERGYVSSRVFRQNSRRLSLGHVDPKPQVDEDGRERERVALRTQVREGHVHHELVSGARTA